MPLPVKSKAFKLAWSNWRRAKRLLARNSHYRIRLRIPDSKARAMFLK
jgi:hypothetical protein